MGDWVRAYHINGFQHGNATQLLYINLSLFVAHVPIYTFPIGIK